MVRPYYGAVVESFFGVYCSRTITVDNTTQTSTLQVQEYMEYLIKVEVSHKDRVIGSNVTVVTTHLVGVFMSAYGLA